MKRSVALERFESLAQPAVYGVINLPLKFFLTWKFDLRYEGMDNIPRPGPCLIAAKQHFNYDAFLVGLGLWTKRVTARFIMRDLYLPPLIRQMSVLLLSCLGARRILRRREILRGKGKKNRRRLLVEARERISGKTSYVAIEADRSGSLLFFPEGTRSPGKMKPFRREFFESVLSLDQDVNILPVGIEYAVGNTVHVRFGEPFPCVGVLDAVVNRCYEDVRRLSGL